MVGFVIRGDEVMRRRMRDGVVLSINTYLVKGEMSENQQLLQHFHQLTLSSDLSDPLMMMMMMMISICIALNRLLRYHQIRSYRA